MRYKVAPEPRDLDDLRDVRDALPLVPGSVEDCCTRIRDRAGVPSRDAAREWLTFLQALGLAAETSRGYHRVREAPDDAAMRDALVGNVFPVREMLEELKGHGEPMTAEAIFEGIRKEVPRWERERYADWEGEWYDRVTRLLEWAAIFGLVETDESAHGETVYALAEQAADFS